MRKWVRIAIQKLPMRGLPQLSFKFYFNLGPKDEQNTQSQPTWNWNEKGHMFFFLHSYKSRVILHHYPIQVQYSSPTGKIYQCLNLNSHQREEGIIRERKTDHPRHPMPPTIPTSHSQFCWACMFCVVLEVLSHAYTSAPDTRDDNLGTSPLLQPLL